MAKTTSTAQRIGYAIILVILMGGTLGAFVLTAYQAANPDPKELASRQEFINLQNKLRDYQNKMAAWQKKISDKYSPTYLAQFKEYEKVKQAFNAESVKELTTKDLKLGSGAEIKADTKYYAYYIGWLPDGKVFDSSLKDGKLAAPIEGRGLIEGWNKGVLGMKIGGVRELTIPAKLAYGEAGSGSIPANSPIKFVVMAIPPLTAEEEAERPQI